MYYLCSIIHLKSKENENYNKRAKKFSGKGMKTTTLKKARFESA
jgi:hypothetical protein